MEAGRQAGRERGWACSRLHIHGPFRSPTTPATSTTTTTTPYTGKHKHVPGISSKMGQTLRTTAFKVARV